MGGEEKFTEITGYKRRGNEDGWGKERNMVEG